jgi:biotin operon repressor
MEDVKQEIKRLKEDLIQLDGVWEHFGFGMLQAIPTCKLHPDTWRQMEESIKLEYPKFSRALDPEKAWLDPEPNATICIRWWGDKNGVEAFIKWCRLIYGFFQRHPDLTPELYVPPIELHVPPIEDERQQYGPYGYASLSPEPLLDYHLTLNVISKMAVSHRHITKYKEHEIESSYPFKLYFLELEDEAISIAKASLDQMPSMMPFLQVNGYVILVKGEPVVINPVLAQFIAMLLDANGNWVSGTDIKKNLDLPETERIDRTILDKLPREVRDQIESEKGKGYRLRCN